MALLSIIGLSILWADCLVEGERGVVVGLKYSHCLALHKNRCRLLAILIWSSKNYCVLVSLEKIGQKEDDNGGDKAEVFLFHNVSVFNSFYRYYYWLQNWPPIPAPPFPPVVAMVMVEIVN